MAGPDHWFSETPTGFADWIKTIHSSSMLLGSPFLRPTNAEKEMRVIARRSVVALRDIAIGDILDAGNTGLRRPGDGLHPDMLDKLLGLKAARAIQKGERLSLGDIRS
jgi:N-acetylneuraminate synthase/N,N'-diacetyllegionaminate synthase